MFKATKELRRTRRTVVSETVPVGLLVEVVGVPTDSHYEIVDLATGVRFMIEKVEFDKHFERFGK
jgi:hypothetical protein